MARIRAIHPRAPLDEDVASLPMEARVLWAYLPCYADREGRLEDRPLFLKGQVFPSDSVDVSAMLDLFAARGFVIRYTAADGRKLIQVAHFHRYQRPDHHERSSVLPAPANWEPAARYGSEDENAQATPRQRPGKEAGSAVCAPECQGNAAPGIRDPGSGTPVQGDPEPPSRTCLCTLGAACPSPILCEAGRAVADAKRDAAAEPTVAVVEREAMAELAKIRPRTAHDLIHCLRVAVQREQPKLGPWNPGQWGPKDARAFLEGFEDVEQALDAIEARIDVFARDPGMSPWTPGRFAKEFNALGGRVAAPSERDDIARLTRDLEEIQGRKRGAR